MKRDTRLDSHAPPRAHIPSRMIDELMEISLQRPIAAGGVRVESTARVHRDISCLLHRLDREIFGRLDDDAPLATDPGDDGRPVFVIVASTRLTLLTATTRSAPQRLLPALRRLPLMARGMVELISFDRACQLTVHLIGESGIAQPPAPAIAGAAMEPQLSGDTA